MLLLVAATRLEVEPLVVQLTPTPYNSLAARASAQASTTVAGIDIPVRQYTVAGRSVDLLITGVGMVATAAWCASALASGRYTVALNLGVCGSFDPAICPGDVVHVATDCVSELGAEDDERFLTVQELGLLDPDSYPFRAGRLVNDAPPRSAALERLPRVDGITVNTVHGHAASIGRAVERFHPQVESMEGAAFVYACLIHRIPFAQVRAVSNVVERRNRAAWRVADAIQNLASTARAILEQI